MIVTRHAWALALSRGRPQRHEHALWASWTCGRHGFPRSAKIPNGHGHGHGHGPARRRGCQMDADCHMGFRGPPEGSSRSGAARPGRQTPRASPHRGRIPACAAESAGGHLRCTCHEHGHGHGDGHSCVRDVQCWVTLEMHRPWSWLRLWIWSCTCVRRVKCWMTLEAFQCAHPVLDAIASSHAGQVKKPYNTCRGLVGAAIGVGVGACACDGGSPRALAISPREASTSPQQHSAVVLGCPLRSTSRPESISQLRRT